MPKVFMIPREVVLFELHCYTCIYVKWGLLPNEFTR